VKFIMVPLDSCSIRQGLPVRLADAIRPMVLTVNKEKELSLLLDMEGFSFFLESRFLWLMLFGEEQSGHISYWFAVFLVGLARRRIQDVR
jgi:hypothetical protein